MKMYLPEEAVLNLESLVIHLGHYIVTSLSSRQSWVEMAKALNYFGAPGNKSANSIGHDTPQST